MATITLKFDTSKVERNIDRLIQRFPQSAARALNRSIVSARTLMAQRISADTGLKSGDVKAAIVTREARADKLSASIEVRGARIPLYKFGTTPKVPPSRGKGRGVASRLKGGAGRLPHAFVATMKSGHTGVFERVPGAARLAIYELYGPSLSQVFGKYLQEGLARGQESYTKNLQSEFRFAMSQTGT